MGEDEKKFFSDGRNIDADDENEIRYWLKYFNTSREELLAAVSAVGGSAQRVKEHLDAKRNRLQEAP